VLTPEISERVEALRHVIEQARAMPMSSSVVVNRAELLGIVAELETACRISLGAAQSVVDKRDEVLAAGHDEARELVRGATLERDRLVSDTEVFRVATRKAEEAMAAAEDEAEALVQETDGYVAERLAAFEGTLDATLEAVRRGRQRLETKPKQPQRGDEERRTAPGGAGDPWSPFAALANDSDVDDIVLPEHLDR
jgi:hypothetical protein